jgi:hypothetical protein
MMPPQATVATLSTVSTPFMDEGSDVGLREAIAYSGCGCGSAPTSAWAPL